MVTKSVDLYGYFGVSRGEALKGLLHCYLHDDLTEMNKRRVRPAMLVIPGGGYACVSQREGEPVAAQYFAEGFNCFVLEYDVAPLCYPLQITQAGMAMMYLRREAEQLGVMQDKIAAIGFSAGGHLTGCIGFLWDDPALKALFGEECARICPDALVFSYAVVTADKRFYHGGSFENFCGKAAAQKDYSLENNVRRGAPPCFLWSLTRDDCVPVENSLLLYKALKEAGAFVELHLFEQGWHGISTADLEVCDDVSSPIFARIRQWLPLSVSFLRGHGFTVCIADRKQCV